MKVKVLRAFLIAGEAQPVGDVLDVADQFGRELIAYGKAERCQDQAPAPAAGPMTTATTGAIVPGRKKAKGVSHVGQ